MKKIAIIGAGVMGSGIAQKTAQEGLSVVLVDVKKEFVEKGLANIRSTLQEAVERKILKPAQINDVMGRIQGTTNLEDVKDCDLVIEAVFEDMKVKKGLLTELDKTCGPKTILATNTSSFSVDELAGATARQDRFAGLHFFFHPAKNRLLEIIPGSRTSPETLAACKQFSQLTGKTEILVKDAPGFAVNRFFIAWYNEAFRILGDEWADIPTIEQAAINAFGIGMGPFELTNVSGIPIAYHAASTLGEKFGPFYAPTPRLKAQMESGKLWALEGKADPSLLEKVADRLLAAVFFVASSLVDEGVTDMTDADVGAKVGLRWRFGPFELMNRLGIEKSYRLVKDMLKAWPDLRMPKNLKAQYEKRQPWDIRYVRYSRDGIIGRVTISRPDAMNALNHIVVNQIEDAFIQAEDDPDTKAVVLQGAGKAFVAGADIKFFVDCIKENRLDDNYEFTAHGQDIFNRIDDSKKQVVAKVDGLALGGGFELALAADVIVATPKAVMGFPETGIGIYPGLGGTQRTSRYIGKELAKYLILTGRIISAEEAHAIGLVDYVSNPSEIDGKIESLVSEGRLQSQKGKDPGQLPEEWRKIRDLFADKNMDAWLSGKYLKSDDPLASKIAGTLAKKAPVAIRMANQIVDAGYEKPLKEGLKEELSHLHEIFSTRDALIGLTNVGKKDIKYEGK